MQTVNPSIWLGLKHVNISTTDKYICKCSYADWNNNLTLSAWMDEHITSYAAEMLNNNEMRMKTKQNLLTWIPIAVCIGTETEINEIYSEYHFDSSLQENPRWSQRHYGWFRASAVQQLARPLVTPVSDKSKILFALFRLVFTAPDFGKQWSMRKQSIQKVILSLASTETFVTQLKPKIMFD